MSMTLPDRITYDWLVALDDDALLTAAAKPGGR
jgi:hypothetical protein